MHQMNQLSAHCSPKLAPQIGPDLAARKEPVKWSAVVDQNDFLSLLSTRIAGEAEVRTDRTNLFVTEETTFSHFYILRKNSEAPPVDMLSQGL